MIVAGQTIYVATSAEDIGGVWKNTKTISLDPLSMDMYSWMGISKRSRDALFTLKPDAKYNAGNSKPITPNQMVMELHHQQESGARLDELFVKKTVPALFRKINDIEKTTKAASMNDESSVVMSLFDLCVDLFVTQPSEHFWGPELLRQTPNLTQAFMDWEHTSWKFMFQLPTILAQDMAKAKSTITGAFTQYYRKPRADRPGSAFFVNGLEDLLREVGFNEDELGKFTMLHYWA